MIDLKINREFEGESMKPVKLDLFKSKVAIVLLLCTFLMCAGFVNAAPPVKKIGPAKPVSAMKADKSSKTILKSFKTDLMVSKVELGKDCRIKFTVKNNSKGKLAGSLHHKGSVNINVAGKPSKKYSIPFRKLDVRGLLKNAGGRVTYLTSIKITKTVFVKVDVDPKNLIPESNETNNSSGRVQLKPRCMVQTMQQRVGMSQKPDLIVDRFTKSPENPLTTDEIVFSVRVKNNGPGKSKPCKLKVKIGGESQPPSYSIPALRSGARFTIQRKMTLPVALTFLGVAIIDDDNKNLELNEYNNETELIFSVANPPRPDLIVERITNSPEHPVTTDEIAFSVRVNNQGPGASRPCKLELKVGGESVPPKFDIPALRSGASFTIRRHMTLPVALTFLAVGTIDKDHQVIETDESNNETELRFTVANPSLPDLIVESLTKSPENPITTDEIAFTTVVRNQGPGASQACKLEVKIGGEGSPPKYDVPALAPGATFAIRRHITLPVVTTYLGVATIDKNSQVVETDETNNETQLIFSVANPPRPDLTILSFKKGTGKSKLKGSTDFQVIVKNIGPGASKACNLSLKIGGESNGSIHPVPVISPNGTYTINRSVKLPRAVRYRGVTKIDVDNANIEVSETNNEKTLNFRVSR